ncbi:hypothetical protein [Burkholderia ambifaria]|uniref:hypothetical protein n=1 Tax=Burkholderia ambifaria TaxID=152480 RepID=UPI002FDFE71E
MEIALRPDDANAYWIRADDLVWIGNKYEAAKVDRDWYPYAGIWRHLAATRINVDDAKQLDEATRVLTSRNWPYPIVEYILDRLDKSVLLQQARTGSAEDTDSDMRS